MCYKGKVALGDYMPRRPHLELFNPDPSEPDGASFHLFPDLPAEIRLVIWNHALRRSRLLQLDLEAIRPPPKTPRYTLVNGLGRPVTGDHYRVVFKAKPPFLPEIARVNCESRDAADAFYAAKIPCYIETPSRCEKIVLGLNFDWDYLDIAADRSWKEAYVDFIHDLCVSDPRGRGPRHLIVSETYCQRWFDHVGVYQMDELLFLKPSDVDATALAAFGSVIRNLESVWYMGVDDDVSRGLRSCWPLGLEPTFNYALPVCPAFTFFDLPARDPRNISTYLTKVWCGYEDLRTRSSGWAYLLGNLGIGLDPAVDVRFMLGSRADGVRTRAGASRHLHEEDFEWLRFLWWYRGWDKPRPGEGGGDVPAGCMAAASGLQPGRPRFDGPQILVAAPRPALGFWLFQPKAFPKQGQGDNWSNKTFNLSQHWPDLALAYIR